MTDLRNIFLGMPIKNKQANQQITTAKIKKRDRKKKQMFKDMYHNFLSYSLDILNCLLFLYEQCFS